MGETTRIQVLFDATAIAARVDDLAREIAADLPTNFVVVGLLKGSFVFVADLVRSLDRCGCAPAVEFMRVASYGHRKTSSGKVRLIGEPPQGLDGRDVLLVDDITDTGRSLEFARRVVRERGAARIWTCTLLDKPSRREIELSADFVGFSVPDVFVVGYGVDYAERYRHLPYIGTVD